MQANTLTRRERQIMDALYRLGRATAAEIRAAVDDPPGYSAIRAQLRTPRRRCWMVSPPGCPRTNWIIWPP